MTSRATRDRANGAHSDIFPRWLYAQRNEDAYSCHCALMFVCVVPQVARTIHKYLHVRGIKHPRTRQMGRICIYSNLIAARMVDEDCGFFYVFLGCPLWCP